MYDPLETDLSFKYLNKISKIKGHIIIGGWATFFYVNEKYKRAFGIDYIKSRDIDVFIKSKNIPEFIKEIKKLGFVPSSYFFRFELIYNRLKNDIISKNKAKKLPIYNLVYVFLDLFTDKNSKIAWAIDIFGKAKIEKMNDINVIDVNTLLELKCFSFFEREKLDKELKDACDIYALLMYSKRDINITKKIKKAIEKIIKRKDLGEFIAENVLKDITKVNIVNASLENIAK